MENPVELRQLRYFVAVAEEGHVGRAARRVGIAQPPLSQQMQRLEVRLGVALFDRSRRRLALTEAGRTLLGEARVVLAAADRFQEVARQAAGGEAGTLRVGFVGSAAFAALPELVRTFRARHPRVVLDPVEMPTGEQVEALAAGTLDAGIVRAPAGGRELQALPLADEPLLAALPDFHPLAARAEVPLAALAGEPFVLFARENNPPFYDDVLAACRAAGFSPRVVQVARSMPTIASLVAAGIGVALVPAPMDRLRLAGVAYRPLRGGPVHRALALVWRRDDPSPLVANLVAAAADGGAAAAP
ncbi:MAG TPA: LysR family transcriptional regulator [Miltoncostaeaceae bacterium]|nr:LysR family transcriptional regulator [Miltoncostaeaceae bacterium]